MKTSLGPPAPGSILLFAGSGDIDERNMHALLSGWLPEDLSLEPPVIQADIPAACRGLRKVRKWLGDEFPDGGFDTADDIAAVIRDLEPGEISRAILVMLWGSDGGDEPAEQLVDLAMRRGITVLDLADGLDTLELGDRKPAEEPQAARRTRRSRAETPASRDSEPQQQAAGEPSPWEPDAQPAAPGPETVREFISRVVRGLHAFADSLQEPAAAPPSQPPMIGRPRTAPAKSTTTWLQNPDNEKEYRPRGRGQIGRAYKNWREVTLTDEQVTALGLTPQK